MVRCIEVLHIAIIAVSTISCDLNVARRGRRKYDYGDTSLWKKEYENELTDAMMSGKKRDNITRVPQSAGLSDNEVVVEKLMDTITSSEKYLKKVDSIDFRLNRLDIEVHEKTNNIMKHLTEIGKDLRDGGYSKLELILESVKNDIYQIKILLEKSPRAITTAEGGEYHADAALDSRLISLESQIKNVMMGVDSITTTISEVKNRQYNKNNLKSEPGNTYESMSLLNEFRKTLHEQKSRKCDCNRMASQRVDRTERYPTDCHEIQMQGFNVSGIYKIKPDEMDPFYVLCDLTTSGGGWTVLQNRFDGSQEFYKGWSDYKNGFGNLAGEFWLGLEKLHYLTNQKLYELRIEIETVHGHEAFAGYSVFTVGPEHEGFRISTLGTYYGTAGDSLSYHAGQKFSTFDTDYDEWKDGACAVEHGGAWWYKECDKSNLNGRYSTSVDEHRGQSIYWISFKGPNFPLTKTKMLIRPLPASRPNYLAELNGKTIDISKLNPGKEKQKGGRVKSAYDVSHSHQPYRYEDHADAFFPNYA